jgi:hypothetical protein
MNKNNFSNLHSSLKSSFQAVGDDVKKLRKRDVILKQEIDEIKKHIPSITTRDEFFNYVKKVDEQIEKAVDVDLLTKTHNELSTSISDTKKELNNDIIGIKDRLTTYENDFKETIEHAKNEFSSKVDELKSELKKTENLKKEVKEVRNFKKELSELEKTYAKKKLVDDCFDEQDEIYELIENLEERMLRKKDVENFQKIVEDKLMKFNDQMKEVEDVSEKLNKKLKEIYEYEISLNKISETVDKVVSKLEKVSNDDKIKELHLMHNDSKQAMKSFEVKLNEVIDWTNNENEKAISKLVGSTYYAEESNVEDLEVEKIKTPQIVLTQPKSPTKKVDFKVTKDSSYKTDESSENKSFFRKIIDWFFEEVDDDEEIESELKDVKKVSSKPIEIKTTENDKKDTKLDKKDNESKKEVKHAKKDIKVSSKKVSSKKTDKKVKSEDKKDKKASLKDDKKSVDKKDDKKSVDKKSDIKTDEKVESEDKSADKKSDAEVKKGFFRKVVDWLLEEEDEESEDLKVTDPNKKE